MISAKRIVEIFRTRGGGEEFIRPASKLPLEQLAYLKVLAEGEPLIAKLSSQGEWLVLTESHLVIERSAQIFRVPFEDIYTVDIPRQDFSNSRIKIDGGNLDLGLRDGASLHIKVQPGGPYFGLMNVLMRIATINARKQRFVSGDRSARPTTNDRRPTTRL